MRDPKSRRPCQAREIGEPLSFVPHLLFRMGAAQSLAPLSFLAIYQRSKHLKVRRAQLSAWHPWVLWCQASRTRSRTRSSLSRPSQNCFPNDSPTLTFETISPRSSELRSTGLTVSWVALEGSRLRSQKPRPRLIYASQLLRRLRCSEASLSTCRRPSTAISAHLRRSSASIPHRRSSYS